MLTWPYFSPVAGRAPQAGARGRTGVRFGPGRGPAGRSFLVCKAVQTPLAVRMFAVAVGAFAEVLRRSPHASRVRLSDVEGIAASAIDGRRERAELLALVQKAGALSGEAHPSVGLAR